jgi:hypothetical protein
MQRRQPVTLDDVYGSDRDRFPLEQEALDWDEEDLGLVWDETEVQNVARLLALPARGPD